MKIIILVFPLFVFFNFSCRNSYKKNKEPLTNSKNKISYNKIFEEYIDSFSFVLNEYKDVNNIMPIGYLVVESMDGDSIFKIRMECVHDVETLKKTKYNEYFVNKYAHLLVNYGLSNLVNLKSQSSGENILKSSKIGMYQAADTKFPTWLLLIKNSKIIKINKNANSKLSSTKEIFAEFTKSGTIYYELDEWGDKVSRPKP